MCPFCGDFEETGRDVLQEYVDSGTVQVRYHVLSILDDQSSTQYSTRAANAQAVVLDTSGPDVAAKFHDLLFENQPEEGSAGLSDDELVDLAVQAGATEAEVARGIEDREFEQWVKNGTDQASKDDVTSTPTVKVNDTTVESQTIEGLVASMAKEIDAASGS